MSRLLSNRRAFSLRILTLIASTTPLAASVADAQTPRLTIPTQVEDAPYDIGAPPPDVTVRWPVAPTIRRTVNATTLDQALAGASAAHTRVHVTGAIAGTIEVRASDVEIEFAPGASADAVWVANSLARVAIRGGRVDHVEMELPATFTDHLEFRPALMTTDVLVDGVEADADDTAFLMRSGVRIAIVNSRAHAGRYCVWFGDTGDFESEDVILAGNVLESAGPEATVRLVHVVRSATVENRLTNSWKHNYRTHGRSDLNWAARNLLVGSGIMLGTMDGDAIDRQYFDDNVFHHTMPSLLEIHLDVPRVFMRRNTIYSDVWTCLLCRETPAAWVITGTVFHPYQPPPAQ